MKNKEEIMNELYAEAGVKVRPPFKNTLIKALLIAGIVFFIALSLLVRSPLFGPMAAVMIVVAIYYMPRLSNVEYEYIFCDGQFDFDRISGGAKRKTMLTVDMENVEVIASPMRRGEYENISVTNVKDFSDDVKTAFMMIVSCEDKKLKVYFKPTEKMIECMYYKAPSKVKK